MKVPIRAHSVSCQRLSKSRLNACEKCFWLKVIEIPERPEVDITFGSSRCEPTVISQVYFIPFGLVLLKNFLLRTDGLSTKLYGRVPCGFWVLPSGDVWYCGADEYINPHGHRRYIVLLKEHLWSFSSTLSRKDSRFVEVSRGVIVQKIWSFAERTIRVNQIGNYGWSPSFSIFY